LDCKNIEPVLLFTDRKILEIILRNLLDNAIKYTSAGSVTLRFEHRDGGSVITVADTGRGMPPDKIKRLEAYAKKPNDQLSDTFGYRFIYTLAEKIDASIQIVSELHKGTSISIFIPAK
jgi:signal transduction histidine kinase